MTLAAADGKLPLEVIPRKVKLAKGDSAMSNHPSFTKGYEFARAWRAGNCLPDVDVDTEDGRRFEVGLAVGMLRNSARVRQAWEEACVRTGRPDVDAVYRPAGVLDDRPLEPSDDADSSRDRTSAGAELLVGHGYQMSQVKKPPGVSGVPPRRRVESGHQGVDSKRASM
jgi:hypothetical protein